MARKSRDKELMKGGLGGFTLFSSPEVQSQDAWLFLFLGRLLVGEGHWGIV